MANKLYYDITGFNIEKETGKAIMTNECWIPKSKILTYKQISKDLGGHDRMTHIKLIPLWIAIKNNFPYNKHTYDINTMLEMYRDNDNDIFELIEG